MSDKTKAFLKKVLCGIAIGVGFVLPGVSGGVLAVSMGLFEPMIEAVKGILKRFRTSFLFLFPIGIGGVIGIVLTSFVLKHVIDKYESETLCLFIGFMLGSLPTLWAETKTADHPAFRKKDALWILAGFLFMMSLLLLDTGDTAAEAASVGRALPIPLSLLAGVTLAVGVIIPGLSSSFLLEYLGLYKSVVNAVADIYLPTLFFAGIGFVPAAVIVILGMSRLFRRYHAVTYLVITGISVGSMALILPNILSAFSWICIPLLILGFAVGLAQSKRQLKRGRRVSAEFDITDMVETLHKQ